MTYFSGHSWAWI